MDTQQLQNQAITLKARIFDLTELAESEKARADQFQDLIIRIAEKVGLELHDRVTSDEILEAVPAVEAEDGPEPVQEAELVE